LWADPGPLEQRTLELDDLSDVMLGHLEAL
jgi:hypothetical protein